MIRKIFKIVIIPIFICIAPAIAKADIVIVESPANWRLQNYMGDAVTVFYSSSSCTIGQLIFDSTATDDDKNRFWSLVLTAKANGSTVGVWYINSGGNCIITSFFAPP